jgi:hypothetical protein
LTLRTQLGAPPGRLNKCLPAIEEVDAPNHALEDSNIFACKKKKERNTLLT